MGSYSKGQFEGWQVFSTEGPHGAFKQPFIENIALIINNMVETGVIKKLYDSIELLDYHLKEDSKAHGFNINNYVSQILHDLYIKYRKLGYLTDEEEMFRRMFLEVNVATLEEAKEGISNTKIVNVPDFRYMMDTHEENLSCHHNVFSKLLAGSVSIRVPTISLFYDIPDDNLISNGDDLEYSTSLWDKYNGTIVINIDFDFKDTDTSLITLDGNTPLQFLLNHETKCIEGIYTNSGHIYTTFNKPLYINSGLLKIALTYNKEGLRTRLFSESSSTLYEFSNFLLDINIIKIHIPFSRSGSSCSLRSFYYYPYFISDLDLAKHLD